LPNATGETIFVSIASYRDVYCSACLDSIFEQATHPENIRIGLVVQYDMSSAQEDCRLSEKNKKWEVFIRRVGMPHYESKGPTYARWLGARLYEGETYFMQIDAHSLFVPQWDVKAIAMYKSTPVAKSVITAHPAAIEPHYQEHLTALARGGKEQWVPYVCRYNIDGDELPRYEGILISADQPTPFLTPFVGAGLMFGPGQWVLDVPFDPYLDFLFSGEELLHSVRLWTAGWETYAPNTNILYHNYNRKANPSNVWADYPYGWRPEQLWSLLRLRYMMAGLDHPVGPHTSMSEAEKFRVFKHITKYGAGTERTVKDWLEYAHVDWAIDETTGPTGANRTQTTVDWWCSHIFHHPKDYRP
jgi:hypothetical protein